MVEEACTSEETIVATEEVEACAGVVEVVGEQAAVEELKPRKTLMLIPNKMLFGTRNIEVLRHRYGMLPLRLASNELYDERGKVDQPET